MKKHSTSQPAKQLHRISDSDFVKLSAADLSSLGEQLSSAPTKRMTRPEKQRLHKTLAALRSKRPPGRPRVGQGAKSVLISLEGGLLAQADRCAKQQNI